MAENRDALFEKLCLEQGYLAPEQLAEAREAQRGAGSLGMELSLPEVLVSKKLLTREQCDEITRIVNVQTGEARVVGGYEVVSKLGEGGMGVVYKARRVSSGEHVALKILPPSLARHGSILKRFTREAEITSRLAHENIVRCIEFGFDRDKQFHFCALELVEGEDLAKRIAREGAIPEAEALQITHQIARAIEHAGSHGLIHRDIKPQNIMLTPGGTAKLLDLGLARSVGVQDTRLTQTGTFAGSPHYASPEQARGEREIDVRADIYSLGATLYHMVTGDTPFKGSSVAAVLAEVTRGRLPWPADVNPDVSEGTCRLIAKMMMKDPADRHQTPAEVLRDLEFVTTGREPQPPDFTRGRGVIMRPGGQRARGTRSLRPVQERAGPSPKIAYIGGAIGAVAVAAVAILLLAQGRTERPTPVVTAPAPPPVSKAGDPAQAPPNTAHERERELEQMYGYARKHFAGQPGDFGRALAHFERIRDEGRGTRFELMADAEIAKIRELWRRAALAALGEASEKARAHVAAREYDRARAALSDIPAHFSSQISAEIQTELAAIENAVAQEGGRLVAEITGRIAGGGFDGARTLLSGPDRRRLGAALPRIEADLRAAEAQLARAEQAKHAQDAAKARDALAGLLTDYERFLDQGQFVQARDLMAQAASEKSNAAIAGTLAAASRVARALQERQAAIRQKAESLIGKTVTLGTADGPRKGEVDKVGDDGLELVTKIIINRRVMGTNRYPVAWSELSSREEDSLAEGWSPPSPEGDVARALIAVGREDVETAENEIARAAAHPVAPLVRRRIDALKAAAHERGAQEAWREIQRLGGSGRLPEAKAKVLLAAIAEFEKTYASTALRASVADQIKALRERAEQSAGTWFHIPPGRFKVELHGGAVSSVAGDTLNVTVPQARGDHARIPVLLAGTDFRLKFAYSGPMLEMFLRKGQGWRGCLLVLLTQDTIRVRTYPVESSQAQVLTQENRNGLLAPGWHTVEVTLKRTAFVLTVDGRAVTAVNNLPALSSGETSIFVWNTKGGVFGLREVAFTVDDEPSGKVAGILTTRDANGEWLEVKGDGETFARRYVPLEDAAGVLDRAMATQVKTLFCPNRIELVWKLQVGQRRIASYQMGYLQQGITGTVVGVVTEVGTGWFDLKPPDEPPNRYCPRWIGGMPAAGGGLEKPILQAIARLKAGDQLRVDWVYDHRRRAVAIQPASAP